MNEDIMAAKKPAVKKEGSVGGGGYLKKLTSINRERSDRLKEAFKGEYNIYCGDPQLQWCIGGYTRGRLNLLWGPTKSGKSTIALQWAAKEQKAKGGYVLIFDAEYNYEEDNPSTIERFIKAGLDPDYVIIAHGNSISELFGNVEDLRVDIEKESKKPGDGLKIAAILVDSWGGISVAQQIAKIAKGEVEEAGNTFGGNSKFINPLISFFLGIAGDYGVTCFFVQHLMSNMDQYGKKYILLGGHKLRFLVHMSVFFETVEAQESKFASGGHVIKSKEVDDYVAVGKKVRAFCDKSRQLVEGRKVEFWYNFEDVTFAKSEESLFDLAMKLGIIGHPVEPELDKKGNIKKDEAGEPVYKTKNAFYAYPNDATNPEALQWHGKPKTLDALKDQGLFDKVFEDCMKSNQKNTTSDETDVKGAIDGDEETE